MNPLTRRRLLLGALATTTLSACGFRLRGAIDMPFSSAFVDGNPNDPLIAGLQRQLLANDVELTDTRRLCWRFQRSGWFDDDNQRITRPTSTAFARYNGTAARTVMYLGENEMRSDPAALAKWGEVARAVRGTA